MNFELYQDDINERNAKFFYLVDQMPRYVTQRQGWLDWFTARQRPGFSLPPDIRGQSAYKLTGLPGEIRPFKNWPVVHLENSIGDKIYNSESTDPISKFSAYGVIPHENNEAVILLKLNDDASHAPFNMGDQFILADGMIPNYHGPETVTDVGKFFLNYLLLVDPFNNQPLVPYINGRFNPGELDDIIAKLIADGKIGRKEYNKYIANGYTFCEDGSLATPCWSEASLTIDPKVLKRKEELFKKYKDTLDNPSVMATIEKELVELDKSTFKDDPAEPFMLTDAGKIFGEQRRKFFIQFGLTSDFSKYGGIVYMENSLAKGVGIKDIPIAANEVRRGSYGRGKETANGGVQTKFLLRIFQNVKITEDDCGTHRGLKVHVTPKNYKIWVGRYDTTTNKPYTLQMLKDAIGTTITIRSPMFCATTSGYCKRCCGEMFEKVDIKAVGMQGLAITSAMTAVAMKSQHSSTIKSFKIKNINEFIRT